MLPGVSGGEIGPKSEISNAPKDYGILMYLPPRTGAAKISALITKQTHRWGEAMLKSICLGSNRGRNANRNRWNVTDYGCIRLA